jgi:hypothetical protein
MMKKIIVVFAAGFFLTALASCPGSNPDPGEVITERPSTAKYRDDGLQVRMTMWGEPHGDPRNAIGYVLEESGTQFFDTYVVLYGGSIRQNDCLNNPKNRNCRKTGLHLCFDDRAWDNLWSRPNVTVKPVTDAGIKVLMNLIPGGGACVGAMYQWPMEAVWPWKQNTGTDYPYDEAAVEELQRQIIQACRDYGLDGVAYDEEYGNLSGVGEFGYGGMYPEYSNQDSYDWTGSTKYASWALGGRNIFRFAYELQKKWPEIVQEVYEIRYGAYIPTSMALDGNTVKATDLFNLSYFTTYGSFRDNSGFMPRDRYCPCPVDLCSGIQPTALPRCTEDGIEDTVYKHKRGNYGAFMFYGLSSHAGMNANFPNYYGTGKSDPEYYLSKISTVLFGEKTVYKGLDY